MEFGEKLVDVFTSANIPLYKPRSLKLRAIFRELGQDIPSESSCRNIVPQPAERTINKVKELASGHDIFFIVDESEVEGVKYLNTLIGTTDGPENTYLVTCKRCGDWKSASDCAAIR